jgi:hypothetical protein
VVSAAIAGWDLGRLRACAQVEIFIQDRTFAGALHMILAWLLAEPASHLPKGWPSELQSLAAQADSDEKDTALAELTTALATIPADSAVVSQLRHILSLADET